MATGKKRRQFIIMNDTLLNHAIAVGSNRIRFSLPTRYSAIKFTRQRTEQILQILNNWKLTEALIEFPDCERPISIPVNLLKKKDTPIMSEADKLFLPEIQLDRISLNLPILKVLEQFLESPDIRAGLVRRSDNRQIAITEASRPFVLGADLSEAVTWQREDYWYLPDLDDYIRESRQKLEPNNPNSIFEFTWRSHDRFHQNWQEFTNCYRLIDAGGIVYEVSIGIAVRSISQPSFV